MSAEVRRIDSDIWREQDDGKKWRAELQLAQQNIAVLQEHSRGQDEFKRMEERG